MGSTTRSNAEHVLFGIRGKGVKRVSAGVHSVVEAIPGSHSSKPPEVRDRIVQLLGDVPRVELFARSQTPGWDAIGLDIDGQDIRDVLGFAEES
jgi:site-specific DNA-methyltransferase (adenine-specific)